MFCRRHFKVIASIISDLVLSDDEFDPAGLREIEMLRASIADQFATALAADNPSFDRTRFLKACMECKS